VQNPS
jgi:hypothetical protein